MSTILHEFDFIIVNIKCVVIIMVSCFILNQNSTRMWLFVLLEECLMLKMLVENICVNPAFFWHQITIRSQLLSERHVKNVCLVHCGGQRDIFQRYFTVFLERIRCADQLCTSVHSVRMNVARR